MKKTCTASRLCVTILTLSINLLGGGLTFFYLLNISVLYSLSSPAFQLADRLFFIGVISLAIVGEIGHGLVLGKVYKTYRKIGDGEGISASLQFRAINLPAIVSFSSWVLWLFAALIFGGILGQLAPEGLYIFAQVFLSVGIISGITTSILIYFVLERYWQPFIPAYFPRGEMENILSLSPNIFQRLFVLFFLGMMPLFVMAGLSYDRVAQTPVETSLAEVLGELRGIYSFIIGASFLVALFLAFTVGKSLTKFSRDLQNAMRKVLEGNLEVTLPVTTADEMGQLARGFNNMLAGLRQEELVRGLFERYVGAEVAHHLMDENKSFDAELVNATILFIDIRQFTNLSEKLPPETLLKLLNRFLGEMSQAVAENKGLVHKFIGDSIMAIYGTPLNDTSEAPAQEAVATAKSMLARLRVINQIHKRENLPLLKIGIGIASGKIVAGTLGEGARVEYTFIGDAVNLASRLEGMTKELPIPVLLDIETAQKLPTESYFEVGSLPIRGKENLISLFVPKFAEAQEKFAIADFLKKPLLAQKTVSVPAQESFFMRVQKKSKEIFNREK